MFAGRRAPEGAHLAVGPRLVDDPLDGVVAVVARALQVVLVVPLREVPPALVHDHHRVALLQEQGVPRAEQRPVGVLLVVGGAHQHRGQLALGSLRQQHVGGEPGAVAHGHENLLLPTPFGVARFRQVAGQGGGGQAEGRHKEQRPAKAGAVLWHGCSSWLRFLGHRRGRGAQTTTEALSHRRNRCGDRS